MKNSVVMTTYNGEKYIIEQLNSIKNQTLAPDEVIICDDCSTDGTCRLITDFILENKLSEWELYQNKENLGFFDNFFKALRLCTGDVIYLADQDDVWDLNKIKTFTELYEKKYNLMMIQSNFLFIDECGRIADKQENYHGFTSGSYKELTAYDMCKFAGSGYTMSFRKDVLDKAYSFQLEKQRNVFLFHDILLGLMSVSEGKCLLNRKIVDKHRIHENNVTKSKNKNFTAGRTRQQQIEILDRRNQYFNIMASCTADSTKKQIFETFAEFSNARKKLIEHVTLQKFIYLLKKRNMYASKAGLMADLFYSIGLERVIRMVTG